LRLYGGLRKFAEYSLAFSSALSGFQITLNFRRRASLLTRAALTQTASFVP
jgi:hypothetical protein